MVAPAELGTPLEKDEAPEAISAVLDRVNPLEQRLPFKLSPLDEPVPYALTEKALEALGLVASPLSVGDEFRKTRELRRRKGKP